MVSNAEAAVREMFQKSLITQVLDDLVHQGEAWRRNSRGDVHEMGDHIPLRPALAGVHRTQEGSDERAASGVLRLAPERAPP